MSGAKGGSYSLTVISTLPTGLPPADTSKNTTGFDMVVIEGLLDVNLRDNLRRSGHAGRAASAFVRCPDTLMPLQDVSKGNLRASQNLNRNGFGFFCASCCGRETTLAACRSSILGRLLDIRTIPIWQSFSEFAT